jgi:hypothetical protein
MFSISSTEFTELPTFVEKVKTESVDGNDESRMNEIRTWCADRGFLLHFSKTSAGVFYTLKYDRAKLTEEKYDTLGRFRSVVFDSHGKVCCVAPPKMLKIKDEMNSWAVNSAGGHITAEELIEGIMVNLFWYPGGGGGDGKWFIATKSCVGEVSFDHIIEAQAEAQLSADTEESSGAAKTNTFQKLSVQEVLRRRICDVLSLIPGGLGSIPKEYCYSLVIQHPKNQIVNVITVPKLYLVAVYQLSDACVPGVGTNAIRIDRDIFSVNFGGSVSHMPSSLTCIVEADDSSAASTSSATFTPHTVEDYCKMYASMDTRSVSSPGVVFVDKDTGFCYKKRNPKYESVKKRKGMEQKLMAQYLQLRKDHGIDEYLKYHPQHARAFRQFRDRLHDYTQRLYDAYIEHYVKKDAKPLKEYDRELKTHMYKLHYDLYLATMKESGAFVTKHTVINYVNQLATAQQLACLNATAGSVDGAGVGAGSGSSEPRSDLTSKDKKPFQRKPIERSKSVGGATAGAGSSAGAKDAETRSGFRSAKPSRGGRMVPTLTVQIPRVDESSDVVSGQVKGSKGTGVVKVQNRFAGLDMVD